MQEPEYQSLSKELADELLNVTPEQAVKYTKDLLGKGIDPLEFYQRVYTPALKIIGERFGSLEIFLPELVEAAEKAKVVADLVILPAIPKDGEHSIIQRGTVVIGTVNGDLHNIGKTMVSMMLSVNGFKVIDMGVNVASRVLIQRALDEQADILALSALITTSMEYMKEVVELRNGFGYKDRFGIIIGGAPVSETFAREIGAEAYGDNAAEAVERCIALLDTRSKGITNKATE